MRRLVFVLILSTIFASCTFAGADAEIWFSPYPAAFNVNLEDIETYCGVQGNINETPSGSGYSDQALIGVVGFGGLADDDGGLLGEIFDFIKSIEFVVSFETGDKWNYVSASEPYLKRPFGIDVVVHSGELSNSANGVLAARLGYDSNKSNNNINSFEYSVGIPQLFTSNESWIGLYLKLPDDENNDSVDLSSALSADDYYARMKVRLIVHYTWPWSSDVFEWDYVFNGYIGEELPSQKTQVFLNIIPDGKANALQVSELGSANGVEIGSYSYVTQAYLPEGFGIGEMTSEEVLANGIDYHIFASSSPFPNDTSAEPFRLINTGIESNPDNKNVIEYQIGLDSNTNSGTIWYDGTSDISDTDVEYIDARIRKEQISHSGDSKDFSVVFEDEGRILIRAAAVDPENVQSDDGFDASDYRAGVYTSTVYLHVVSDK